MAAAFNTNIISKNIFSYKTVCMWFHRHLIVRTDANQKMNPSVSGPTQQLMGDVSKTRSQVSDSELKNSQPLLSSLFIFICSDYNYSKPACGIENIDNHLHRTGTIDIHSPWKWYNWMPRRKIVYGNSDGCHLVLVCFLISLFRPIVNAL